MQNFLHLPKGFPELAKPSVSPSKLIVLVVVLAIVGSVLVLRFASAEEKRELVHWQNKLNLIADSRTSDVNNWLENYFLEMGEVAKNPSLQLYITALQSMKNDGAGMQDDPAQKVYLRNLLLVTSDRLGFSEKVSPALQTIPANINKPTGTGIAIIDASGKIIVSTEGLPGFTPILADKITKAPKNKPSLIDMFVSDSGDIQIGFIIPVYAIQTDPATSPAIASLVGIKTVNDNLFKLLRHPGATEKTLEAMLVRKEGDNVVYLSPVKDTKALSARFLLSTPDLDAAYAIEKPGEFALKNDGQSHEVLMTSRTIEHSPWVLLLHIDKDQAMAESNSWRGKLVAIMFFALIALIASVVAAWWYGSSRRATLLSMQTARLAAHSVAQEKLLRLVTDNQPEPIFISDAKNIVRFANEKCGKLFNSKVTDMIGKELGALMGVGAALEYKEANNSALTIQKDISRTHVMDCDKGKRIIHSEHIPLSHIPIDGLPFPSPGVLVVDQDITEIVTERERSERILTQVVNTLVRMVDMRDPYSANHSASVAMIAHAVAEEMGLEKSLVDTAEVAGKLMNIGKIIVPSAILTKKEALAQNEIKAIRNSLQSSVTVLQGIDFEGPVVETLRQAPERFDGTGPLGLKGEDILVTARIIAVANSFIGMISPRSYRAAIHIHQATSMLLQNIDTQFDRRVVVALINFVENKEGREQLAALVVKK
jgi:HD-GYP domain-containing protein (c-di-GMP phosphodiesterase class II)